MTIMHKDFDLARELLPDSKGGYPVVEALMSILDLLGEETFENWREIGHRAGGLSGQCPCFRDIWPGQAKVLLYSA